MSKYTGCDKCKNASKTKSELPCIECTHNATDHFKPMTNADRIRNMTDEELARDNIYFVSNEAIVVGLHYTGLDGKYYKTGNEVYDANLKYLQAEVKEGAE